MHSHPFLAAATVVAIRLVGIALAAPASAATCTMGLPLVWLTLGVCGSQAASAAV